MMGWFGRWCSWKNGGDRPTYLKVVSPKPWLLAASIKFILLK
jgi:hypothetical protein